MEDNSQNEAPAKEETKGREILTGTIDRFIVRARRVEAHSMVQSGEIRKYATPEMEITIDESGATSIKRLVPEDEEKFESLAARLRPFIVPGESLFLKKVIEAIKRSIPKDRPESKEIKKYALWFDHRVIKKDTINYSVQALRGGDEPRTPLLNNQLLAESWIYSDLVHADPHGDKAQALELGYSERYQAAVSSYCELAVRVMGLLGLVRRLSEQGILKTSDAAWKERISALKPGEPDEEVLAIKAYVGPVGAVLPNEGSMENAAGFEPITLTKMMLLANPSKAATITLFDEVGTKLETLGGAYDIRGGRFFAYIDEAAVLSFPIEAISDGGKKLYDEGIELRPIKGQEWQGSAVVEKMTASDHVEIKWRTGKMISVVSLSTYRDTEPPQAEPRTAKHRAT